MSDHKDVPCCPHLLVELTPRKRRDGSYSDAWTCRTCGAFFAPKVHLDLDRRERIATAALQGVLSNPQWEGTADESAQDAISAADALIARLDQDQT